MFFCIAVPSVVYVVFGIIAHMVFRGLAGWQLELHQLIHFKVDLRAVHIKIQPEREEVVPIDRLRYSAPPSDQTPQGLPSGSLP